jgi:hypothetical protein
MASVRSWRLRHFKILRRFQQRKLNSCRPRRTRGPDCDIIGALFEIVNSASKAAPCARGCGKGHPAWDEPAPSNFACYLNAATSGLETPKG